MIAKMFYFATRGILYEIDNIRDPWAELCIREYEDTGASLRVRGTIHIGETRHKIIDKWPNSYGDGNLMRWTHGETGESMITGVFNGKSRTWRYDDFLRWQKALIAVVDWQKAQGLGSRVTAGTMLQADKISRRYAIEELA